MAEQFEQFEQWAVYMTEQLVDMAENLVVDMIVDKADQVDMADQLDIAVNMAE